MERLNKIAILFLVFIALFNMFVPYQLLYRNKMTPLIQNLEIHHALRRVLCFFILFVAWKLYKRVSMAWVVTLLALSGIIFMHIKELPWHTVGIMLIMEVVIYIILIASKNYYSRKINTYSIKRGIFVYIIYLGFILGNAEVGLYHLKKIKGETPSIPEIFNQVLSIMLDPDNLNLTIFPDNMIYHRLMFWFCWTCVIIGLLYILTPFIGKKIHTPEDISKARELVKVYGQNCSSYLALEKDKMLFFGKEVEGCIAYGIIRDTVVVLGDPICAKQDVIMLVQQFREYCNQNGYTILFLNTTDAFLEEYRRMRFGVVKCGDEPRIDTSLYSLSGKAVSKVRLNINHANKAGIVVKEYCPTKQKDKQMEEELLAVSKEWFSMKRSSELVFTMGSIGFENPMDRRYFYAKNSENKVEAFIVFVPFGGMNGYMTDVTRHSLNATRGVMEKILYEAILTFKEEKIQWVSLAAAPLAGLEQETEVTAKLLNLVYLKMNRLYGFKNLYQTKLKYNPTVWEPSYYVYDSPVMTPAMAYAIVKIQNPLGIRDFIKSFLHNLLVDYRKKKQKQKKEAGKKQSAAES